MMIMSHPQALAQLFLHRGGLAQRNKIETPIWKLLPETKNKKKNLEKKLSGLVPVFFWTMLTLVRLVGGEGGLGGT